MMTILSRSIGAKLFLLLALLIVLAMAPFCFMVYTTLVEFGRHAANEGRKELASRNSTYLAGLAREQAHRYDAYFSQAEISVSLMAAQARDVFDSLESSGDLDVSAAVEGHAVAEPLQSDSEHGVATVFAHRGPRTVRDIQELVAMVQLDPVLKGGQKNIRGSVATHLITVGGVCRYFRKPVTAGRQGEVVGRNPLLYSAIVELLEAMSRHSAVTLSTRWTRVYGDAGKGSPMISVLAPVVDRRGTLRAVAGVDISLDDSIGRLEEMVNQSEDWTRGPLFSFLLDNHGEIISFPENYRHRFGLSGEADRLPVKSKEPFALQESSREPVRDVATRLLGHGDETVSLALGQDQYLLAMHVLHRLDWHLVLVTREEALTGAAGDPEQAMSGTLRQLAKKFLLHLVIILLIILLVVYIAVDHFVGPLKRLSEAATQVGRGEPGARCRLQRQDELGVLADSFNSMVDQLETARSHQEQEARQLEKTVRDRTRDLRNKNIVLRDVIEELNTESERRQRAVEALAVSEEQIRTVMDASVAGHGIIQDQQIRYVNAMGLRIFGYSREEMVDCGLTVRDLVVADQYELVQQMVLEKFRTAVDRPMLLECRRKDGTVFDALVGGAITSWNGRRAVVATIMDISDQKQTEDELRSSKLLLQKSLAEKEVLLREIYHRTKNNMLVIISMLQLQALELDNDQVRQMFSEMEHRIRAMSLVHEKLYQSQNLTEIDLGQYLREMVSALVQNMVLDGRVAVRMNCQQLPVSIDNAVPLGLAVNEIVTNSLKHAFPGGRKGTVTVDLCRRQSGIVEVVVADDGIGLSPGLDPQHARSLGMQIAANLIVRQLRGSLEVRGDGGVSYRICFTEPFRPTRV